MANSTVIDKLFKPNDKIIKFNNKQKEIMRMERFLYIFLVLILSVFLGVSIIGIKTKKNDIIACIKININGESEKKGIKQGIIKVTKTDEIIHSIELSKWKPP